MTPEETLEIAVGTNGMVESIYKDELHDFYKTLGRVVDIQRASHIAWEDNPDGRGWTIRAAHNRDLALRKGPTPAHPYSVCATEHLPLVYFELRSDALAAEVLHFWDLLPGTRTNDRKDVTP